MMSKIWEKYFLKETLKTLLFFILGFYFLFVLIDYSTHSSSTHYHHSLMKWKELSIFYMFEFIQKLDVLLPFAILLATTRTLCNLNVHNELVALMASGISLKTLLRPFIIIGLAGTLFLYVNSEYLIPHALSELRHMGDKHAIAKKKSTEGMRVKSLSLKDETTLLFQKYDTSLEQFYDAYWIKSTDEIYRIKYLSPYSKIPKGRYVDHLIRNKAGELIQGESFTVKEFPEMRFNKKSLLESITPLEENSLTTLWKKFPNNTENMSEKETQVMTIFYQKIISPWLCLIAVLFPAPFCVRFSRNIPTFFIYAITIFGLFAFFLIMDAASILGKRQVLSPNFALWPAFAALCIPILWRYKNL